LHIPDPLSTTRAAASSSHILKFCFQKFVEKKKEFKVRTVSTQLDRSVLK
jgi:hypothetical protein